MSSFAIKLLAIISMIIDHAGAVFALHIGFRIVGRIAFPLFVFLIAEGCRHTKSMEKYMLRLGIFALVSEIPFDLAFNQIYARPLHIDFLNNTNIFYTLWLGVFCVYCFQQIRGICSVRERGHMSALARIRTYSLWLLLPAIVFAAMSAADWLGADYGGVGVLFIFFTALMGKYRYIQLAIIALFMFALYFPAVSVTGFATVPLLMLLASLIAVIVVAFNNGKRGPAVKWMFYWIYPGHLLLFAALRLLIFM